LRAFLRQDPNIIMVGEIRDLETANIAIKAALTGHLVLSTLHTNSAAETVTRLMDMGIEGFNVASAINLIVAQRLLPRVCLACAEKYVPDDVELATAKVGPDTTLRDLEFSDLALADAKPRATRHAIDDEPGAAPRVEPGVTMSELLEEVEHQLRIRGSRSPSFPTHIFTWGERPLDTGDATATEPLPDGEAVLFDFGAVVDGYCSDFGRTVVCGEPPAGYEEAREATLTAQECGRAAAVPGALARDVNAEYARQVHVYDAVTENGRAQSQGPAYGFPGGPDANAYCPQ